MTLASPQRAPFTPDGLNSNTEVGDDVPALSCPEALARFEFEAGKGNEGTKVLMVEIDEQVAKAGDWEIEWSSKTTVLSAKEGADGSSHRVYFLLAPGTSIPPVVKLTQGGRTIQTNPLPAIFPPSLGVSATTAGKKGVLHTIWGKQRLSVLQKEIETEMKNNGEGIGLEMALQEKQWIEENFGLSAKPTSDVSYQGTPSSPKTPGGGRLAEKLKGLKLGISVSALNASPVSSDPAPGSAHPLSPNLGDIAVSSFAAFHGGTSRPPRIVAQIPPSHLVGRQNEGLINSLDAVADGTVPVPITETVDTEDGLFAVKMSPRSPEMTKSPFSFAPRDTAPYKDNE